MKRLLAVSGVLGLAAAALTANAAVAEPSSDLAQKSVGPAQAAAAADDFVKSDDPQLMLSDDDVVMRTAVQSLSGLHFTSYERTHQGVPVVGGDFVVVTDAENDVAYTQVAQDDVVSVSVEPTLDADGAGALASDALDGDLAAEAELVVFAWDDPALAWESVVDGVDDAGMPTKTHVFVDAHSGELLDSYETVMSGVGNTYYNGRPGTVEFGTSEADGEYVMEDPDRPGLSCAPEDGSPYTSDDDEDWGDGSGTDLETACVDAMYGAGLMWDMMDEWLERDGVDGDGNSFPMYVGLDMVNAYWTGSSAHFGHSSDNERQIVPMDVVAHELGHGVFQFTPGGSGGGNETGGLNEGTGDIFGALNEWYDDQPNDDGFDPPDYLVGEEAGLSTAGEPIRDMADPGRFDHPACWSDEIPDTPVHAAAGPINHWYYLTAEGTEPGDHPGVPGSETCDGSTIEGGLGPQTAGVIWMGALNAKSSNWTYAQARTAALEFAANAFDTCDEFTQAQTAFDAVDVPADSDPTCS